VLKEAQAIGMPGRQDHGAHAHSGAESVSGFDHRSFLFHVKCLANLRKRASAASLAAAVLTAWFRKSYPRLGGIDLPVPMSLEGNVDIDSFALALSRQPLLEATYWLSSAYAKLLHHKQRKALSMYFTPPLLVTRVLDDLAARGVKFEIGKFLDPACGGSAFLVPIALRMKQALRGRYSASDIIKHVESHLLGIDLDATLCILSRQFLRAVLHEEIEATSIEPRFAIFSGNSLLDAKHLCGAIDVVICNPPYRKMAADEVHAIKSSFGHVLASQPNLYGIFIASCVQFLKVGATAAVVTPTSFLSGHSFAKLRSFLTTQSQLLSVGIVSAREGVFIDVQQETAITTIRRGVEVERRLSTSVSLISPQGQCAFIGECVLPASGDAWPIPRASSDVALIAKASRMAHRLSDYGYQIRVGNYVWNRDERKAYSSERVAHRFNKKQSIPLLWSSDIKPGNSVQFDGAKKANGERRFVVFEDQGHAAVIRRPCVLLQRVTSNDQSRRLVAGSVPQSLFRIYGGFVGENHTVILVPTDGRPVLSPIQLARLLGCPEIDRLFRCISGATNVSVFELGQLPLPDPQAIKEKLKRGASIELAIQELMRN